MSTFKIIFSLLLFFCFLAQSLLGNNKQEKTAIQQTPNYKKIEVQLTSDETFEKVTKLGIDVHCGVHVNHNHKNGETITLEVSDYEYQQLVKDDLNPTVLIDNLSTYYAKRNAEDLPKAKQQLAGKKATSKAYKRVAQDMSCTENSYPVPQNFNIGSMGGFTTYQELLNDFDKMANLYPNLITLKASASSSGQTTIEGRPIYYVKVSDNPNVDENEPEVLYTGLHHAREPVSMMNLQYYLWYLLENYGTDPTVTNIVNHTELYFIPVVNPDGYVYNQTTNPNGGGLWRKNRRNNGDGTIGVDLNRNYGYQWGYDNTGSSPNTNSSTYRGTAPFSEPETQIVKAFAESHNFINVFNNHSYSNFMLYPFGYSTTNSPDELLMDELSEQMCWHNRYAYGSNHDVLYALNGDAGDWFYAEQSTKNKSLAWLPEIGSSAEGGFWPPASLIQNQCERHLKMSLIMAESATNHGILSDLSPYGLDNSTPTLTFNIQHMSLAPGSFTISVSSTNSNVVSITNPVLSTATLSNNMNEMVSTTLTLANGIVPGTLIDFQITLNNGTYNLYETTITKMYNPPVLLYDDCNDLSNWTSSNGWGIDNSTGYNANGSITDSPTGNSANGTRTITLNNPVDLSAVTNPVLEFYTKWDIFRMYSYVQLEISTNSNNWSEVCGLYTKPGANSSDFAAGIGSIAGIMDQPADEALYDGYQESFVREEIDLSSYAGVNSVYFRFTFRGDADVSQEDGFWFDDFTIYREPLGHCENAIQDADETDVDCGGVDCIACPTCFDGIQNGNETGVDCGGSNCVFCPPCPIYDFNTNPVLSYDPGQDFGSSQVQDGGATLYITGNVWKAIDIGYTITPQTVLTFDFKSTIEGEIHELGFDNDLLLNRDQSLVVYGNQGYAGTINSSTYSGSGNWESFAVNLGAQFTGTYQYLLLTADDDENSTGNSYFRNVKIFEDSDGDLACDIQCTPGTACNDNDACTVGETYDNSCNCTGGTLLDTDNDGICDTNDVCPGLDDNLAGTMCDDLDPCTTGETYDSNCTCSGGTFADSDNDGVCDANDICPGGNDNTDTNMDGVPDDCYTCPNTIVDMNFPNILYDREAIISITTNGEVSNGTNVQYYAGQLIELLDGFEVKLNADFHAFIAPCD